MPDGFLFESGDGDFRVQMLISHDLDNAQRLYAAFRKKYPAGATRSGLDLLARQRDMPSKEALYPETLKGKPQVWLAPVLRRLRWQTTRGDAVREHRNHLSDMAALLLRDLKQPTGEVFASLARHADCIQMPAIFDYLDRMGTFAKGLEKSGPLAGDTAEALRELLAHAQQIHKTTTAWQRFVWPFFRSEAALTPAEPCWTAGVRRDIQNMDSELRALWLAAFDGRNQQAAGACEPSTSCRSTLKELGSGRQEAALRRWIALLKEGTALSPAGTVIFRHVLLLIQRLEGQACDDLLYAVACAPWRRASDAGWIETYLWILARRPKDRCFACLEALAMNPVTATEDVRREYEAALEAFVGEARGIGIDGYRWDTVPALEPHQRRIEELLQLSALAVARGPYVHPTVSSHLAAMGSIPEAERTPAIKLLAAQLSAKHPWFDAGPDVRASLDSITRDILRQFSSDPVGLNQAAVNRWEWIHGREKEYSTDLVNAWKQCFWGFGCDQGLAPRSLKRIRRVPSKSLVGVIQGSPGRWKVFELCQKHVAEHGWNVELAQAFREWISTLGTSHTDNQYRAKAEWFLWFEDVLPIKLDACWGERVRSDLRSMDEQERAAWIALLDEATFTITEKPTKKWFQPAQAAFPKIGAALFRRRFTDWFAPFGAGEALRLTVTGRNVLRLLIWAALIAQDPVVDKVLAGFAKATWKTKDSEKKAAQAEMAFSYVMAERSPEKALAILEVMVKSGRAFPGSASYRIYEGLRARLGKSAGKSVK
ncbi:MAG TPA: hypothetical protein VKU19_10725 [Bryobacteraceae bacterium]|nr:hypothetical protein [Bryobacteraceae bacterium]